MTTAIEVKAATRKQGTAQFINIALWESAEAWRTAMAKHEPKEKQMQDRS